MTRGGKRNPGPGKTLGRNQVTDNLKKVPYSTRIRPDQRDWLKGRDNAAREIEKALDSHILKKDTKPTHNP